jgi:hypothetical protein
VELPRPAPSVVSGVPMTSKFTYYARNYLRQLLPRGPFRRRLAARLNAARDRADAALLRRVDYYNKLAGTVALDERAVRLDEFRYGVRPKTYFFDAYRFLRYFPPDLRVRFVFGDLTRTPPAPSLVKSRPLAEDNSNAVLFKLNWIRHFHFVRDRLPWREKRDLLVGRSTVTQPNRIRFLERYYDHPLCDVGQINRRRGAPRRYKPRLSIRRHLEYKFILCLEGNDVASNLKWVMSSNSLAVMPPPSCETWFMEGLLEPDVHYVALRPDYADLEDQLHRYLADPAAAESIIDRAHEHVARFDDPAREEAAAFLTLEKYFQRTGQRLPPG